jgi:hypothetical protein
MMEDIARGIRPRNRDDTAVASNVDSQEERT